MKSRRIQGTLWAISLLVAPAVLAQETAPVDSQVPAASEAPPVMAPSVEAPPPAPPAVAAPVPPALDARLSAVEAKAAGTEETVGALQSTVDGLKKIKVGGFVQGRYEYHQDALDGWSKYKNENRFYVRHGYLGAK